MMNELEKKRLSLENKMYELDIWLDENVANDDISNEEYEAVGAEYRRIKNELYAHERFMILGY